MGVHLGVLGVIPCHVDGRVFGVRIVYTAHVGSHFVTVNEQGNIQSGGGFGCADADRARDHAGVGAAVGFYGHAAVLALVRVSRGNVNLRRADIGVDFVVEIHHRKGARAGEIAVFGTRIDRAGNGFGVIIRAGQEVQQIHALHQVVAGHFHLDGIALAVLGLFHVQDAGVRVLVRLGGIGDQGVHAQGVHIVVPGHHALIGQQGQFVAGNLYAVPDIGFHFVVADDDSKGSAHAHAAALGHADAARANGQLALVGSFNIDLFAVDDGGFLDLSGGLGVADQHGNRPGNGGFAARAADGPGQGLGRQKTGVLPGVVLGQVGSHGHVARGGFVFHGDALDRARYLGIGFVPVDAHRHAHGNRIGIFCQGNRRAGAQGAEIALVARQNLRAVGGHDGAADAGAGNVLADRQADGGRHLHGLVLLLRTGSAQIFVAGRSGFPRRIAHRGIAALGVGGAVHILGFEHIGGKRRFFFGGLLGFLAFFVQLIIDFFAGVVLLAGSHLIIDGALGYLVDVFLGDLFAFLELLSIADHIRAHGGGHGVAHVLADAGGPDIRGALAQLGDAAEFGIDRRINDVHRHSRAHGSRSAHGKAAGVDLCIPFFFSDQQEIGLINYRLLLLRYGIPGQVLFLGDEDGITVGIVFFFRMRVHVLGREQIGEIGRRVAAVSIFGDLLGRFLRLAPVEVVFRHRGFIFFLGLFPGSAGRFGISLNAVFARGDDGGSLGHLGGQPAVQQVNGGGSVHGNILGRRLILGSGQRIGARHAGGIHLPLRLRPDVQGTGGYTAVPANGSLRAHVAVSKGERRADAHGLALAVFGLVPVGVLRRLRIFKSGFQRNGRFCLANIIGNIQLEEAVLLADADGTGLFIAIDVLIGNGHRGGQAVHLVGGQLALHLVLIYLGHFAAGDGAEVEAVFLSADGMLHKAILRFTLLYNIYVGHDNVRDRLAGHMEAVYGFRIGFVVDGNDVLRG